MFYPGPAVYMQKLVVPGAVADAVDLDAPIGDTLAKIAKATDRAGVRADRGRARPAAARGPGRRDPRRRAPGSGSCSTATWPARSWRVDPGTGVDLLVGVGGTPEGVLAACALRCLGGEMFGRLIARDDDGAGGRSWTPASTWTGS